MNEKTKEPRVYLSHCAVWVALELKEIEIGDIVSIHDTLHLIKKDWLKHLPEAT